MSTSFEPLSQLSTKRIVLPDGTIQIGEQFVEGRKVGEKQVGRGTKGEKKGAGSNIFKANAIEEIYKRGVGSDGNYDIGLIGQATGVTQEDIDNYDKTVRARILSRQYDGQLEAAGARKVQWGDDINTVQNLLKSANEARRLEKTEPKRIATETAQALAETNRTNREIRQENRQSQQYLDQRRDELLDRQDQRRSENRRYELEIMRLQQADKLKAQELKDRMFMTLMAGLQNLGQSFTI